MLNESEGFVKLIDIGIAAALVILLSLTGCSGLLIHQSLTRGDVLTPEQIAEYDRVGSKVFSCFALAGPPPAGSLVLITIPKESTVTVKFSPGCVIQMQ